MSARFILIKNIVAIVVVMLSLLACSHNKILQNKHSEKMMTVSQFLFFDGNCQQAMAFYKTCLGGTLTITPVSETPMKAGFPPSMHNRIINARLTANGVDISACDWMRPDETFTRGNMNCLYISGGSREETRRIFDAISEHANVTDPLNIQPFGYYGALNDQFGVRWMFHAE